MAVVLSAEAAVPQWQDCQDEDHSVSESPSPPDTTRNDQALTLSEDHGGDLQPGAGALIVHTASALMNKDEEQPQDQLELLLAELGRIETQQEKLRDAVKHNKQIVIHPRQEVLEETDSEYDTPKAPTPKKKLVVSGGLTGFGIAQDLLQIDFSPPDEAPEEFRAVAFFDEPKEVKPGLSGSFGLCDPASKEMHHYLERLEEQQRMVLELITGKKQQLLDQHAAKGPSRSKQGPKSRPAAKSRLSRNTRLGDVNEKAAVANALGVGSSEKTSPLGPKSGSLSQSGKGTLAAKLPMMGLSERETRPSAAARSPPARSRAAAQARQAAQAQMRRAQVQGEDLDIKEQEEIKSQFAEPMMGTTPSTQHLAGKKGAKERAAKAAKSQQEAVAEADESPPEAVPEVKEPNVGMQRRVPVKVHAGGSAGRVSTLGSEDEQLEPSSPVAAKSGVLRGLKNMLKGKLKP